MSRVGKNSITIPANTTVNISQNRVDVKGPLGSLIVAIPNCLKVTNEGGVITVIPNDKLDTTRRMWGTVQRLIMNAIHGVAQGFEKSIELVGVGYRASVQGNNLVMQLGYSHDIEYPIPPGISIKCEKPTLIKVSGFDKQRVGQVVSKLKTYRPPEPYKGKGVIPENHIMIRKEGKKK